MITLHKTSEATAFIPAPDNAGRPITVIGTDPIRDNFDKHCLQQTLNSRAAPGISHLVLNPDAHSGYGAPVGCVMASPTHIYPGPVGVDIKCSMSLLQTDVSEGAIKDRRLRRSLINAICERTPTGAGKGQRSVSKSRPITEELGYKVVTQGASEEVCEALGIPVSWATKCEDSYHLGHDKSVTALEQRLDYHLSTGYQDRFHGKMQQLGSYGGGNHFGEAEIVRIAPSERARSTAQTFGLQDGRVAFLSHCGSRGFGHDMASGQFKALQSFFETWGIPYPSGDKQLVYAPLGSPQANDYIDDMSLASNFATVNHLLINALVLEAFQEILPATKGELVYLISHNIAREEVVDGQRQWIHRKGATRAFPAGHHELEGTPFSETGHPILLPGNPRDGSMVMAGLSGAEKSCYSVNHGAGRQMGRKDAKRRLDQASVDHSFDSLDILSNCRKYPLDEAPDAYKDFAEVLKSVEKAELAYPVAKLEASFVIKDGSKADD